MRRKKPQMQWHSTKNQRNRKTKTKWTSSCCRWTLNSQYVSHVIEGLVKTGQYHWQPQRSVLHLPHCSQGWQGDQCAPQRS
eukprot:9036722-Pyramimonas_sp.AAC.1